MATHDRTERSHESTVEKAKEKTESTVDQVKDKAGEYVDQAQERVRSTVAGQKREAAQDLDSVAQAFRETGQHLREQEHGAMAGTVGQYTEQVAKQVEQVAGYLREKDVDQLMSEAENLARRQPMIFVGSAFAAGILLARFLKSSSNRYQPTRGGRGYYETSAAPIRRRSTQIPDYESVPMTEEAPPPVTDTAEERHVKRGMVEDEVKYGT